MPRAQPSGLSCLYDQSGFGDGEGWVRHRKLTWEPDHGETIPQSYDLRPEPAVPISGKVVDEQGQPIAGAKVTWLIRRNDEAPADCRRNVIPWRKFPLLQTPMDAGA